MLTEPPRKHGVDTDLRDQAGGSGQADCPLRRKMARSPMRSRMVSAGPHEDRTDIQQHLGSANSLGAHPSGWEPKPARYRHGQRTHDERHSARKTK